MHALLEKYTGHGYQLTDTNGAPNTNHSKVNTRKSAYTEASMVYKPVEYI